MPKRQTFNGYKFDSTLNFTVGDIVTGKVRVREKLGLMPANLSSPTSTLSTTFDEWPIKAEVVSVSDGGQITVIKRLEEVGNIFNQQIALQTDDPEEKYPFRVDEFEVDEYELETVE